MDVYLQFIYFNNAAGLYVKDSCGLYFYTVRLYVKDSCVLNYNAVGLYVSDSCELYWCGKGLSQGPLGNPIYLESGSVMVYGIQFPTDHFSDLNLV